MKELILLKVMTLNNVWFVYYTIFFLLMDSNFKISLLMVARIWQYCLLILEILLLSLLKVLILFVLFMALANLKQFICLKIQCLMIVGIYKMHIKEINIKHRVYFFDNLIKAKNIETENIIINEKNYKSLWFIMPDISTVIQWKC